MRKKNSRADNFKNLKIFKALQCAGGAVASFCGGIGCTDAYLPILTVMP